MTDVTNTAGDAVAAMAGGEAPVLEVTGLKKHFPIKTGLLSRSTKKVFAVDGVSFAIKQGETLGLVGESGCGKTTVGRTVLRLVEPTEGSIKIDGKDITRMDKSELRPFRREMQIIFQDPYASLNPRITVGNAIGEALAVHGLAAGQGMRDAVGALLQKVGLRPDVANRFPHEFSGGQRQRVGIARALALKPKLIVCDEAVSALDVSVRAQILDLLADLCGAYDLTYLFISHDLSVVRTVTDRVLVMKSGEIVEQGQTEEVFERPAHPYTQALIAAAPVLPESGQARTL